MTPSPGTDAGGPPIDWTRTLTGYPITLAGGALDRVAVIARSEAPAHRYAIVTDSTVGPLYADEVAGRFDNGTARVVSFPAGETHKTRDSWARVTDDLLATGLGRDSTIIALGGGVVGDLAGFVAATYMRGIPYVQVPTTLLAMIDASIGGKTGVDTAAGKNLVGAFHRPAAVIIDPSVLATLPARELRAGLAEAVKHGIVADAAYFAQVRARLSTLLSPDAHASADMSRVIIRSIELKASVVERDEYEGGLRKILNFGHTIGHAIEVLSDYTLLHGEAISIGMALEGEVAERAGIAEPGTAPLIADTLARVGLPTARPQEIDAGRIMEVIRRDKKVRGGVIELALPSAIGQMAGEKLGWGMQVPEVLLRAVLEGPEK